MDLDLVQLSVGLRRALRHVEVLVLLLTALRAILYAFANADGLENPALTAELAISNLDSTFVYVLVSKLWRGHFHNDDPVTEIKFTNR